MTKDIYHLCLIADADFFQDRDILEVIFQSVEAGATMVQLRGKSLLTRDLLELGLKTEAWLRPRKVPLIINDRVDVALACGASGVHLGQDDLPLLMARKILGRSALIGVSASTALEAHEAEKEGADYIGAGPVFETMTKPDAPPPLGLEGLAIIRQAVRIPILAIGGITTENAGFVMSESVNGIAVVSAICAAEDPAQATLDLLQAIKGNAAL